MSLHVHVHVYVNQSNNPHHADKRPRLDQLHKLHISGRRIKIIQTLAPRWHFFGLQLNFDSNGSTVAVIRQRHLHDPESGCLDMFREWLKGNGVGPITWRKLAQLLEDFEEKKLAADIRMCFNIK